jgi:hypothetical protein
VKIDHDLAEQFVRSNWPALAATAWRLHLRYGPGALIVEWHLVKKWTEDRGFRFHPHYATRTDNKEFNAVIKDYDPATSIVIAFSTEKVDRSDPVDDPMAKPITLTMGKALAAMTITAVPPPPEAHRARGH